MPAFDADAIRSQFPIFAKPLSKDRRLTYLDSASTAQKPQSVVDAERTVYENFYANAYRGVYAFGAKVDEELEETRARMAAFLGAGSAEEIVFTPGTTMAINLVARGWGGKYLQRGDEILLNEMEHHANIVPWQIIAKEKDAVIKYLPLTEDGRLEMSRWDGFFTERTKLVAVTAMSNVLGTVNPIAEITRRAHAGGAVVLVDGAQSVPHQRADVTTADVDFLACSGHKMFGPSGVGILYGKREHLENMDPFLGGGHMISRVFHEHSEYAPPPMKFEAGTLPIAQAIALRAAIDFIESLDPQAMHAHEQDLLQYAHQRLGEIPGMRIFGPDVEHKGSIASFTIDKMHPEDLANLLDRKGVFVRHGHHCTMLLHELLKAPATTRASFAVYNQRADVDALVDAIQFARERLRLA